MVLLVCNIYITCVKDMVYILPTLDIDDIVFAFVTLLILPTIDPLLPTGLPTGLQLDCLYGLRTTQLYVLVLSLCVGLNCGSQLVFYHTEIKSPFIHLCNSVSTVSYCW